MAAENPRAPALVRLSPERLDRERRRAEDIEAQQRAYEGRRGRVLWQCAGLTFTGVPVYAWSWHLTDPSYSQIAVALALFLSYAAPFLRWLAYHIAESDSFEL